MSVAGDFILSLLGRDPTTVDGERRNEWRNAIHDSKDTAQVSIGAARRSKKASEEALRAAQCAVKLLEGSKDKDKGTE